MQTQSTTLQPSSIRTKRRADSRIPADVQERFSSGLHLVRPIALRCLRSLSLGIDLSELISYGQTGLFEAAQRYDPAFGVTFSGFATRRIRGAILDGLRERGEGTETVRRRWRMLEAAETSANNYSELTSRGRFAATDPRLLREYLAGLVTAMATGLLYRASTDEDGYKTTTREGDGSITAIDPRASPEEICMRAQRLAPILEAIDALPQRESQVIRCLYVQGMQVDECAQECGVQRATIWRLHTRAMRRLRARFAWPGTLPS